LDVLHSPWADRWAMIVLVASRLLGVPVSVHARASEVHRTTSRVGLRERIAHADLVVTNSRFNVERLRAVLGDARRPRLALVYDGVDLAELTPDRDAPREPGPIRLLCVARLIEPKGLIELLRACWLLQQRGEEFLCDVVGGPDEPAYTSYLVRLKLEYCRLGLEQRVRFHGARPFEEVLTWYRRADVFVLPCVVAANGSNDITPNSLIEAMAMRLPVVTTTITALPEIVDDGVSGLLVPPNNVEALAEALTRLIHDPELRRRLGDNARARVEERFDVRRNAETLGGLFRAVARQPNRGGQGQETPA
jgi:glycosyltransferase involved in cell wall biosynthesis